MSLLEHILSDIIGSGLDDVPALYTRYLESTFCEMFKLNGTPRADTVTQNVWLNTVCSSLGSLQSQ